MKQKFSRNELLDFVSRDFSEYAWSLRALDRRLEFFNGTTWQSYTYPTVEVDEVEDAVRRELEGPGKLLGYRRTFVCSNIEWRSRCTRWKRLLNLRRRKTKGNEAQTGFMLLMVTINQCAIKTALSLSPFTDALTLAAEKCVGQRFASTCTKQER